MGWAARHQHRRAVEAVCQTDKMATKMDLAEWLVTALRAAGGSAHHVRVAEAIWNEREDELRSSGDLFYTWQYDLRWAAQALRDSGTLEAVEGRGDGVWRLSADTGL